MIFLYYLNQRIILKNLKNTSRHINMKFAFEVEQNDKLCFLDIDNQGMVISLKHHYTASQPFSGIYTNFNSFIPMTYKCGLIHSLLFRVFNICSSYHLIHEDIETLKTIWRKNCYPKSLIDSSIQICLNKIFEKNDTSHCSQKRIIYFTAIFRCTMSAS